MAGSIEGLLSNPAFMMGTGLLSANGRWQGGLQGLIAAQGYKLSEERLRIQAEQEARQKALEELQLKAAQDAQARQQWSQGVLGSMSQLRPGVDAKGNPVDYQAMYRQDPTFQAGLRQKAVAFGDPAALEAGGMLQPLPKPIEPTTLQRNLVAMGIDPASPMGQQIMLQSLLKPRTEVNVGADIPNPPQGYWYNDPKDPSAGIYPVPGSPQAAELEAGAAKARESMQQRVARIDSTMGEVDRAISLAGPTTAGLIGAVGKNLPATDARTLRGALTTIKANIGFNELQAMREASPTGGALGQVAVQELESLQAVLGSLDQDQDPAVLRENLEKVRKHYSNWRAAVTASRAGQPTVVPSSSPAQEGGGDKKAEINRLRAQHGLPAIP